MCGFLSVRQTLSLVCSISYYCHKYVSIADIRKGKLAIAQGNLHFYFGPGIKKPMVLGVKAVFVLKCSACCDRSFRILMACIISVVFHSDTMVLQIEYTIQIVHDN